MSEPNDFCYYWSLSLENVRCFGPAQTLDLHRDGKAAKWVVLLGDNGVGKTTVLQCLYAIKPTWIPLRGALGILDIDSRSFSPGLARGVLAALKCRFAAGTPLGQRPANMPESQADFSNDDAHEVVSMTSSCHGFRGEPFLVAYGASRKPGETIDTHESTTLLNEQTPLLGAEQWYIEYDYAAARTNSEQAKDRLTAIRKTLIDLLPDVDDLRITGLDTQPPRPTLEAHTPYGWVRVRDLSLGYRTLMAWVVDFAARMFARYPTSPNPLAEPAVCLVDEIDLHLHPAWQRKLIAYLDERFPATQFIVTAHSPLVVQAAEHAKVAVLRRHEGEDFVTIHNDLESVRGWRVDQILTSDLFGLDGSRSPRLNELARERAALLGKPALDDADRARLDELRHELEALPHGDTAQDREAWDLVRRIAASKRAGTGEA